MFELNVICNFVPIFGQTKFPVCCLLDDSNTFETSEKKIPLEMSLNSIFGFLKSVAFEIVSNCDGIEKNFNFE